MTLFAIWRGLDEWRVEAASVQVSGDGLTAEGTQIGASPEPYRLDYRLDASDGFVTRALQITATGGGWTRTLDLRNDDGRWTREGDELPGLAGALDCDLGLSPLTNTMPILRSGLHRRGGAADFVMAWVSVPDLDVIASPQRYEHVRDDVVRYVSRDGSGFTAELQLDGDGLVVVYPELAERVVS